MSMMSDRSKNFIRLILRSPDIGDGWRQVSSAVWPLVTKAENRELLDINEETLRVRLNDEGRVVARYI